MSEREKIIHRWKRFRFFRKLILISFACVIGLSLLGAAFGNVIGSLNERIILFFIFIAIGIFSLSVIYTTFWQCPRCRKPYATTWYTDIPFLIECRYCGLPFDAVDFDSKGKKI